MRGLPLPTSVLPCLCLAVATPLLAPPALAQVAPIAPYSSCAAEPAPERCEHEKKQLVTRYYRSERAILEEQARRLRYHDLQTEADLNFFSNARQAAAQHGELAAAAAEPALRARHLENARRENAWADNVARKFVGGTPESHRAYRQARRDEIEARYEEDLRAFREFRQQGWY